ncbi:hypothetical protein MASR2M41_01320 [Flammeovirgaceae bacterium]
MLSALFMAGLMSACDLFDKADDISFTTDLKKSVDVNEGRTDTNIDYTEDFTIDFSSDPEADKYKDKLNNVVLNKITYKISNFDGAAGTMFSGNLSFAAATANTFNIAVALEDVDLKMRSESGEEAELSLSQTDINTITSLLKNDKAIKVLMTGVLSQGPVSFTLEVKANVKITADAL